MAKARLMLKEKHLDRIQKALQADIDRLRIPTAPNLMPLSSEDQKKIDGLNKVRDKVLRAAHKMGWLQDTV